MIDVDPDQTVDPKKSESQIDLQIFRARYISISMTKLEMVPD